MTDLRDLAGFVAATNAGGYTMDLLVPDAGRDADRLCHHVSGQLVADQQWHEGEDVALATSFAPDTAIAGL